MHLASWDPLEENPPVTPSLTARAPKPEPENDELWHERQARLRAERRAPGDNLYAAFASL